MSTDTYHQNSISGVDAVLDRLCRVVGAPKEMGYAEALDVARETIKSWRRRGEVPLRYLQGFAVDHGVTIDYLQRGVVASGEPASVYGLSPDETRLLAAWRAASGELRRAALRVLEASDGSGGPTAGREYFSR